MHLTTSLCRFLWSKFNMRPHCVAKWSPNFVAWLEWLHFFLCLVIHKVYQVYAFLKRNVTNLSHTDDSVVSTIPSSFWYMSHYNAHYNTQHLMVAQESFSLFHALWFVRRHFLFSIPAFCLLVSLKYASGSVKHNLT